MSQAEEQECPWCGVVHGVKDHWCSERLKALQKRVYDHENAAVHQRQPQLDMKADIKRHAKLWDQMDTLLGKLQKRMEAQDKRLDDLKNDAVTPDDVECIAARVRDGAIPEEIWHRLRECETEIKDFAHKNATWEWPMKAEERITKAEELLQILNKDTPNLEALAQLVQQVDTLSKNANEWARSVISLEGKIESIQENIREHVEGDVDWAHSVNVDIVKLESEIKKLKKGSDQSRSVSPCPFCHAESPPGILPGKLSPDSGLGNVSYYRWVCPECKAAGPIRSTAEAARLAWNEWDDEAVEDDILDSKLYMKFDEVPEDQIPDIRSVETCSRFHKLKCKDGSLYYVHPSVGHRLVSLGAGKD